MLTQDALFGELRSLLQRPASTQTWDALCEHLYLWPHEALGAVALPYALDIVTRWPDEVGRPAPDHWALQLLSGEDVAPMALANRLRLDDAALTPDALTALLASSRLTNLTQLNLSSGGLGDDGVSTFAASALFATLTDLRLSYNRIGLAGAVALAASPSLSALTSLYLGGNDLGADGAAALIASPHLSNLTSLSDRKSVV